MRDAIEKMEDGTMIAKEVVNLKLKLRKLKYTEACIQSGEMNNPGNDEERLATLTQLQEKLHQLEEQSPLPTVRDCLFRVLRKCLLCHNWEHLHCLCVPPPTPPHFQALDGFIPFVSEPSICCDIHTLMSQLYVQFPAIRYACFLYNDFFVCVVCCVRSRFGRTCR